MQLRLGFEIDASVTQPIGEAIIDLDFSTDAGRISVKVRNIAIESSSLVLDVTSRLLSLPLRELLALELSRALNEVISDLPNQVPTLKKVEIIDIQN
ncbi:MAG TPA: hypothetical protein VLG46_07740 [Anaerolineae bacterium]|nr:hypothetical protein [Anaerolineae bacterium]